MSTRKIRLYQVRDTELAYQFSTERTVHSPNKKLTWFPKSVIKHISRSPMRTGEYQECIIDAEEWFLDKLEL